jgi:hypothetical protein
MKTGCSSNQKRKQKQIILIYLQAYNVLFLSFKFEWKISATNVKTQPCRTVYGISG